MERGLTLDQENVTLLLRDRIVADAFRDNEHLSFSEVYGTLLHLDANLTLQNEEEFVFVFMAVPRQCAFDLGDLDVTVVDRCHDTRRPMLR